MPFSERYADKKRGALNLAGECSQMENGPKMATYLSPYMMGKCTNGTSYCLSRRIFQHLNDCPISQPLYQYFQTVLWNQTAVGAQQLIR